MRIRSIKPEFWKSERVASLPRDSRLLFIGLWNLADDAGRFRAHPNLIQGELFPYEPESDVAGWLQALVDAGLVLLYEADGRRYGLVVGFSEHQKIDKRTESRLPPPPRRRGATNIAEGSPETTVAPQHTEPTAGESAAPAEELAEPAERSAADRIREQGAGRGSGSRDLQKDGGMDGGFGSYKNQNRDGVRTRQSGPALTGEATIAGVVAGLAPSARKSLEVGCG